MNAKDDIQLEHAEIAQMAQSIWESEGRPEGRAVEHWLQAEMMLRAEKQSKERRKQSRTPIVEGVAASRRKSSRVKTAV